MDNNNRKFEDGVKFLLHSDIVALPFEQKKKFLKEKGFTEDEVLLLHNEALLRSNVVGNNNNGDPSLFSGITNAVLIGGVFYVGFQGIKKFWSWLNGESNDSEHIKNSLERVTVTLDDVRTALHHLEGRLTPIENRLLMIENDQEAVKSSIKTDTTDLRNQLNSLRSVLLSSKNFSPIPTVSPYLSTATSKGNGHVKKSHHTQGNISNGGELSTSSVFHKSNAETEGSALVNNNWKSTSKQSKVNGIKDADVKELHTNNQNGTDTDAGQEHTQDLKNNDDV